MVDEASQPASFTPKRWGSKEPLRSGSKASDDLLYPKIDTSNVSGTSKNHKHWPSNSEPGDPSDPGESGDSGDDAGRDDWVSRSARDSDFASESDECFVSTESTSVPEMSETERLHRRKAKKRQSTLSEEPKSSINCTECP